MKKHHEFSPSTLDRLDFCPMSYWLSKDIEMPSSDAAIFGTEIHDAISKRDPSNLTKDQLVYYDMSIDFLDFLIGETKPCDVFYEREVDIISKDLELLTQGRTDVVITNDNELIVIDWKFGYEVVNAQYNYQLYAYGLGAMQLFGRNSCRAIIFQPTLKHVSETIFTYEEADRKINHIIEKVKRHDNILWEGKHCKYCPAGNFGKCPIKNYSLHKLQNEIKVKDASDTELVSTYEMLQNIKQLQKQVEAELYQRIETTGKCGKYEFTYKQGNRFVNNIEQFAIANSEIISYHEVLSCCKMSITSLEAKLKEKLLQKGIKGKDSKDIINSLLKDFIDYEEPKRVLIKL